MDAEESLSRPIVMPSPDKSMAPPSGFQSASSVQKSAQPMTSAGSFRNASGGLPPTPKQAALRADHLDKTSDSDTASTARVKPINRPAASKNAIVYNAVQRRNPVLASIKNVGIEIGDVACDYQVGTHNGVLFLSLKYYRLHPEYIHQRMEKMKNMYNLRIMLILCDINEHQLSLRELSKVAIINNYTIFIAWSNDEVAQYLTTFKAYEHKGDDSLKERVHESYHDQLQHVLTSGKKVNKTDADNLASQFGSFSSISQQSSKQLSNVKGLAAVKVTSLLDAFTKPFLIGGLKRDRKGYHPPPTSAAAGSNGFGLPVLRVGHEKDAEDIDADGVAAETEEPVGSPDWPSEAEDADGDNDRLEIRGRDFESDRSPGVSPEPRETTDGDGPALSSEVAWHDPLDDNDEDGDSDPTRWAKRTKLNG